MQVSDFTTTQSTNSSDKTNLLKSILPFPHTYDKTTQEIEITGVAENVFLQGYSENAKGSLVIDFGFISPANPDRTYNFKYYINNCFAPGASEKSIYPTIINLRSIVEAFLGRRLKLQANEPDNFEFNSFKELYEGFLNKITVPTQNKVYTLVEFAKEEDANAYFRPYNNKCTWISAHKDDLDLSKIAIKKMKLLVADSPTVDEDSAPAPTVVEDVDLLDLLQG